MSPPLPSENDRKTFIGCLAAILASSYDYDQLENDTIDHDNLMLDEEMGDNNIVSDLKGPKESSVDPRPQTSSQSSSPSSSTRRSGSFLFWSGDASAEEQFQMAQIATRKRRFDVLSGFLLSSAELMQLDKESAVGFVPIMENQFLLKSQNKNNNNNKQHQDSTSKNNTSLFPSEIAQNDILFPFLDSLNNGLECLSLLIIQYLRTSIVGYDARVRHAIKKLGIAIILKDMIASLPKPSSTNNNNGSENQALLVGRATRKYEALEHAIAVRMLVCSKNDAAKEKQSPNNNNNAQGGAAEQSGISRKDLVRGAKVGAVAVVGGALFAVTGGMAAPAIAAGVGTILGGAAASATIVTLTSTTVLTTLFGVGGGSLTAYKMNRRTQGLQEFILRQEFNNHDSNDKDDSKKESNNNKSNKRIDTKNVEAELHNTICISGWSIRKTDCQQPWGVEPTSPPITDELELLERFYHVHSPENVIKCPMILASYKTKEKELFESIQKIYDKDSTKLYPLATGPLAEEIVNNDQHDAMLDELFSGLGYNLGADNSKKEGGKLSDLKARLIGRRNNNANNNQTKTENEIEAITASKVGSIDDNKHSSSDEVVKDPILASVEPLTEEQLQKYEPPKHLATLWDYKLTYGGELYTATFETDLVAKISRCLEDFYMDLGKDATKRVLQETAFAALLSAVAWPSYVAKIANMIDGDWTVLIERADEAGIELAQNLLYNTAGNRPMTLVGYSFGARIVYQCIKYLAKMQPEWQKYQDLVQEQAAKNENKNKKKKPIVIDGTGNKELDDKFKTMREPASIVEDVIFMGLPQHKSIITWKTCRQVVGGRIVNCYSPKDIVLTLMYQFKRMKNPLVSGLGGGGVCGAGPVDVPGVENIDVSDLIQTHKDYCNMAGKILDRVHHGQPFVTSMQEQQQKLQQQEDTPPLQDESSKN